MPEKVGPPLDLKTLQQALGGTLIWVGLAFLLVGVTLFFTIRVGRVSGEEVGVLLNRITGNMTVINQSGVKIYLGAVSDFFVLDKTLQTLDMTEDTHSGDRQEKDDLKIKTVDGSDVYVDIIVQYKINPEMADVILRTSGPYEAYKEKWARDYVRAVVRNSLGELTTESFYDSTKRNQKIVTAKDTINKCLADYGIMIDSVVIPRKPHFYAEYEEMIKKKKLADQGVLEEQSKAQAAKQLQETKLVEETNRKNVAIEEFTGKMQQKVIEAEANAEQTRKSAEAYYEKESIGAEAAYYQMQMEAQATLKEKTAEAAGIEAMKRALEGEGGRNMVKMEYARKLKDLEIIGVPYTIQSYTERFEHHSGDPAASAVRGQVQPKAKGAEK